MTQNSYKGQVVYICGFDVAYDMKRQPIEKLCGCPPREYSYIASKRSPKQLFFYRPQLFQLPPKQYSFDGKNVLGQRAVKVFSVGAISVQIRLPFEVENLQHLVDYHTIKLDGKEIGEHLAELAQEVFEQLKPYCIRPADNLKLAEDYTVFCIDKFADDDSAENWLKKNRRLVAGILTEEQDNKNLSEQEAVESTERYVSYYSSDIVAVDWDAALVIGEIENIDEIVHIMELANIQLLELGAYDKILDGALETAYRDLAQRKNISRRLQQNLREIRVDTARLSDELLNTSKFFGDWYFAAIYGKISSRFHLADWYGIIKEKLKTLADLYQMLQQDWVNYWMMILEATIVLLFIIDLVLLFAMAK